MKLLRRAGAWALDYAYASGRQLQHVARRRLPERYRDGALPSVLLIPGVYETWQYLRPLAELMHRRGHPIHAIDELGYNRGTVAEMALHAENYLLQNDLTEVIIVAHSKGGLIGKQVMVGPLRNRVQRMLAIATPFAGSVYANYLPSRSLRIFRPGDQTIVSLGANLETNSRIVSIYPEFDPHIPAGSYLVGARNIRLPIVGHFRILGSSLLLDRIERELDLPR